MALIPTDDQPQIPTYAEDAIAAAAYEFEAAAGLDPLAAGWAAQRVMDAIDSVVLATDPDPTSADAELRVWDHPLTQTEIKRRKEDLASLIQARDWVAAMDEVRSHAREPGVLPVDRLSGDR